MLSVCAILTVLISYYISSIFNKGVYLFLLFFSFVVLNIEILSLFKRIDDVNILILTLIEFLICHFIWIKKGRPLLKVDIKEFLLNLKKALIEDKSLILLSLFYVFMIILSFFLAGFSPVNEPDAQGYHALRSLFWVKDGFIHHFETADVRCHSMPINSELFYVWVLSLGKNDCIFGLLEYFSYFLLIFSSYKIMELINIDFNKRIWAILIFSSFAGVISQISSTQTDLIIGSLFCLSMYLFLEFKKGNKDISLLYFSSLSLALSFGVKSTGVMGSIPIVIWYLIELRKDIKSFIKFFLFLIINFLILSSYNYWLNFVNYNHPLGSYSALLGHGFWGGFKAIIANFIRYIFQFFDFAGFTIGFYLNKHFLFAKDYIISLFGIEKGLGENVALNYTNISMTEQFLGFGVLGFLAFLPASIVGFFKKDLRIFSFIFWAQILVLSFSVAYMVYSIRFIVSFVSLAIPLLTLTYFKKMNIIKFIYILFMMFYLGYASMFLSQRPYFYLKEEFKKTPDIKFIQDNMRDLNYKFYPSFNEAYTLKSNLEPYCKNNNKIGLFISNGYMLYSAKYLELNNNCKIDTLNLLHIKQYDLSKYDVLITQKIQPQKIEAINKNDILNPFEYSNKAFCRYEGTDKKRNPVLLNASEIKKATNAICIINEDFIKNSGFKKEKEIEAVFPEYLKERENETVKDFILWRK